MYIIIALLALGVLVIVHEFGHFIMAKVNGVYVEEFSLGMGPKIFGFKGKETEYTLKAFPIGGYVKMLGEDESVEGDKRAFCNKSPLKRISIIIAGPLMNFLFALIVFAVITMNKGYVTNIVNGLIPNSPAEEIGINVGDKIVNINGKKISTWEDLTTQVYLSNGEDLSIIIDRNGEEKTFDVKPYFNEEEQRYLVGVQPKTVTDPTFLESIKQSCKEIKALVIQTYSAIKSLVTGKGSIQDLGGPVSIVRISGAVAKAGMWNFLNFVAYLSLQLAVLNLLPFPALDGGWTVILLIELISRRKVNDKIVGTLNYIGFSILILLMILVTIKDILFPIKI
ncbi:MULTISPECIES: RIP metalloprotease RseP [Clostridium]|uniref:Zinc metalloprotease n=1 Tax=Clostridium cadaveris TaxID=1529 RepID=A0A1I2J7V8_9CLOT|nr:RIP metalloprotease RseP [Clostridium cadaveris]MDU4952440.1 RIP metalloprotease RseP [Clostridium sp.]MDM8312171.1 RIP metalloprotease RseP [Clostridium cadaveris]MDY4950134.1 RIP metalloprotease RseP [Clostridium cadaveris]NME64130.1 RIP metalloprotease RseP [Clostridium cadaveris]NWK10372.1 RIP metalloprotease RseP [Clostridium cadaveris]